MTVEDQGGLRDSATHMIKIMAAPTATPKPTDTPLPPEEPTPTPPPEPTQPPEISPPQASISGPRDGFPGEPVQFDASGSVPGSSPITSYTWDFGNGEVSAPSAGSDITFTYEDAGKYDVTVIVTDQENLSSQSSTTITIDARLDTVVWTLDFINNRPLVLGTAITLQFLEGRIEGFAGCNTYSAEYQAEDVGGGSYNVEITRIRTSRVSCPKEIMRQESEYLAGFETVESAFIEGNLLLLRFPLGTYQYRVVGTPRVEPFNQ